MSILHLKKSLNINKLNIILSITKESLLLNFQFRIHLMNEPVHFLSIFTPWIREDFLNADPCNTEKQEREKRKRRKRKRGERGKKTRKTKAEKWRRGSEGCSMNENFKPRRSVANPDDFCPDPGIRILKKNRIFLTVNFFLLS